MLKGFLKAHADIIEAKVKGAYAANVLNVYSAIKRRSCIKNTYKRGVYVSDNKRRAFLFVDGQVACNNTKGFQLSLYGTDLIINK